MTEEIPIEYQETYSDNTHVVVAVAEAVSNVVGVPPDELDERLHDSVDGDALQNVLDSGADRVEFEYHDHSVIAEQNTVTVR